MNPQPDRERLRLGDALWWAPGLLVALGAAVATAHGLYEVVSAAGVPALVAAVYPLITDGLAVVAYAATMRLTGGGRAYAWIVVVLAAGLSGIAQAVYLAGGVGSPSTGTAGHAVAGHAVAGHAVAGHAAAAVVPAVLRFGVGAWPAVAAALAAHLLFMLGAEARAHRDAEHPPATAPSVHRPTPSTVVPRPVASTVQPAVPVNTAPCSTAAPVEQPAQRRALPARPDSERRPASKTDTSVKERARTAARHHHREHGALPTVSHLMQLANVSRGTAGTALQELRHAPAPLHVVSDDDHASNDS